MAKDMIFGLVGGLGLFLFGMELLSDGLKKAAGQKVRKLLTILTKHRVVAMLVGALVTCLVQSSSATTIMTVGFVNAGLLTLKQALSVVLGANIGTTFTAWLVSSLAVFKITTYSLPAIGIGFFLRMFCKTQKMRNLGQILLGFGILFTGIDFMKDAFGPLQGSEQVQQMLIKIGHNPLLAVFAGTIITMLLQSSSATIAILQILAFNGAFGTEWDVALRVVIPFILGDNIGTTITAQIAALGTSLPARRTAMGHTLFNVIGVLYMLPLVSLGWFGNAVEWITPLRLTQGTIMVHIAVAHSAFNVFNSLLFLPFIKILETIVIKLVPAKEGDIISTPVVLEEHLLNTPEIAIEQAKREILRMSQVAKDSMLASIDGIKFDNRKKLEATLNMEDVVDNFQYEITSYLALLARKELSDELSTELPVLLHTVNDLERVGDHAVNIAEIATRKIDKKLSFSEPAQKELEQLKDEVEQMFERIIWALENNSIDSAKLALANENNLNKMQVKFRRSHVKRMAERVCIPEMGIIFIDFVDNVEKIGDHLTNIAQSIIGGLQWDGVDQSTLTGEYKTINVD